MNVSWPSVHPVETLPMTDVAAHNALTVRMRDVQGMPGTPGGLALRLCQLSFAAISVSVMAFTSDFPSVTAFSYLLAAVSLQCVWSLSLAIVDVYALSVRRSLHNCKVVSFFTIGDGITSTLTFAAACASAGITVLLANDLNKCGLNHCKRFETATAFDEMIEKMNIKSRPPKRRRGSAKAPAPASQHEDNEVLVQTITRFLHDLRTNPEEPDCSTTPGDQD